MFNINSLDNKLQNHLTIYWVFIEYQKAFDDIVVEYYGRKINHID